MTKQIDCDATNPKSLKTITGIALGEWVCKDHGGQARREIEPRKGVCYACAVANSEPVR